MPNPCCALPPQVYGIFYATSFLELYRSPHNSTTSAHNITVLVQRDEQYLFLVGSPPPLPLCLPMAPPARSPDPCASLPGAGDVPIPRAPL